MEFLSNFRNIFGKVRINHISTDELYGSIEYTGLCTEKELFLCSREKY